MYFLERWIIYIPLPVIIKCYILSGRWGTLAFPRPFPFVFLLCWEDVEKGTVLTSTPTCLLSQWSVRALPPRIDRCPVVDWGPSPWNLTRLWQKTLSPLFLPYLSKWRPFQSRKTGFIACFLQIGESSYKCILTSYEATIYLTTDWLSSKWGMPSYGLCANTILQVLKHQ